MTDLMAQNITIQIANENYPLAVEPQLEEAIRTAAEKINELYSYQMDHFGNVSDKQVLSMLLLQEESKLIEAQMKDAGSTREILSEIDALNAELDEYLLSR